MPRRRYRDRQRELDEADRDVVEKLNEPSTRPDKGDPFRVKAGTAGAYFGLVNEVLAEYDKQVAAGTNQQAAYRNALYEWDLTTPEEVEKVLSLPTPDDNAHYDEWLKFVYKDAKRAKSGMEEERLKSTFAAFANQGLPAPKAAFGTLTQWHAREWYEVPPDKRVAYSAVARCGCCGVVASSFCDKCGVWHGDGCLCICGKSVPDNA